MKDFAKMAGAVAVGTLVASGAAAALLLNKKVLKAYVQYAMKISEEVAEDLMGHDYDE